MAHETYRSLLGPYDVPVTQNSPLPTSEFLVSVGFGIVPSYRRVTALGLNPDIDAASIAAPADIWTGGGVYPWMTGATSLEAVSDNVADASAGTGARTIRVNGLNTAFEEIAETVTMNGTTPVALVNQYYRINSVLTMLVGSGGVNAGAITIRNVGAGVARAIVPAGYGITKQSQFTVPAGYTLQVTSLLFSINQPTSQRDAVITTYVKNDGQSYRLPLEVSVDGQPYRHDGLPGISVPEKADFGLRCTYVSTTNTNITGAWLGVLRLNTAE